MRAEELIEIRSGDRIAVVGEQGASLVQVSAAGVDLLVAASNDDHPDKGCYGQVLVPWPGRIPDGAYHFDGEDCVLPIDHLISRCAIHGLVRWAPWQVLEHRASSVTMGYRLLAQPGYPFSLGIEQSYAWQQERLEISATATNIGHRTAPYGYGAHPYFTVGSPTIDAAMLHVPSRDYFLSDASLDPQLPAVPVDGGPYDFRQPRPVGATEFDVTYTSLDRDDEGRAAVHLSSRDHSLTITCTYEESVGFVHLYSGDTLDARRREGLAIEPLTCLPNAFNNGVGLVSLASGTSVTVRWAITAG
jgi:aldose 1-epimerase